ncbi:MAG: glycosyltransferase family 4 protein [Pyrinomonadaceae bacterium]
MGLSSFPVEAAATRFRLAQFVEPLSDKGIDLTISPFLNASQFGDLYQGGTAALAISLSKSFIERIRKTVHIGGYDVLLVQREAMIFGPAIFEWLYQKIGRIPMVLDLDDATYVPYVSPTYGKLGSFFKFFGKTDRLIARSDLVICGNRFIAEYVNSKGRNSVVIPTVVDESIFFPIEKKDEVPVLGWIGTHSTFAFLESLFPVLENLAEKHRYILKIVGSGREVVNLKGIEVINLGWDIDREVDDFQNLDIGLYPITMSESADQQWLLGKSGFKAIQYMSVGVPFVMSPVGVCAEMGIQDVTHFNAASPEDWYNYLHRLLADQKLRREMGKQGRRHSVEHYSLAAQAKLLAESLWKVRENFLTRTRP